MFRGRGRTDETNFPLQKSPDLIQILSEQIECEHSNMEMVTSESPSAQDRS